MLAESPAAAFSFEIPYGEGEPQTRSAYSPKSFAGKNHEVTARVLTKQELSTYRNLALNPCDQQLKHTTVEEAASQQQAVVFPHATTNTAALRAAVRGAGVEPYADRPHRGVLRYLQVAVERASGRAQVVLVGNCETPEPLAPVFAALERALGPRLQGLFWNGNTAPGNAILGDALGADRRRGGAARDGRRESTSSIRRARSARATPSCSSHSRCAPRAAVPDGARVLELYAGTGAIGLGLLGRSASVALNELAPHGLRGLELGIAARPEAERARASIVPGDAGAARQRASPTPTR